MNPIKVTAICGSLRKFSCNRGLIRSAIQLTKQSFVEGMSVEEIDISKLPMYNQDLENDGKYPPEVDAFRHKILESDCFLFASPEYNSSITAPLKNAIDWASRKENVWKDKPAAIVSAGGLLGGWRSQPILRQTGGAVELHFINKPEFFLNTHDNFDDVGNLLDEDAKKRLKSVLEALKAFTSRLKAK